MKNILNQLPLKVASGPFKGTLCRFTESGDGVISKLAGVYEKELFPAFEKVIRLSPEVIVDIGAAEGFYVAGLARTRPSSPTRLRRSGKSVSMTTLPETVLALIAAQFGDFAINQLSSNYSTSSPEKELLS